MIYPVWRNGDILEQFAKTIRGLLFWIAVLQKKLLVRSKCIIFKWRTQVMLTEKTYKICQIQRIQW